METLLTLEMVTLVNGLAIQHSSEWEDYVEMNAQIHGLTKEEYTAYYLGTQWQMQCMESLQMLAEKKITRKQLDKALNDVAQITNDLKKVVKEWAAARDAGKTEKQEEKLQELKKLNDDKTAAQKVVDDHIQQLDKNATLQTTESVNEKYRETRHQSTDFSKPGNDGDIYFSKREGSAVGVKQGDKLQMIYVFQKEPKLGKIQKSDKRWENMGPASEKLLIDLRGREEGKIMFDFVSNLKESMNEKIKIEEAIDIDMINTEYGFWGTMDNHEEEDSIEIAFEDAMNYLIGSYNFTQDSAYNFLNSKWGRKLADEYYDGSHYNMVDAIEAFGNKSTWKKYAKQFNESKENTMKNLKTLESFTNEAAPRMSNSAETNNLLNLRDQIANAQKGGSESRYGRDFEKAKIKALRSIEQMITYAKIGV